MALNYRDENPCSRIGPILGPQQDLVRHMPALPHRDVAAVVETVRASGAAPVVKLAFEFLVLTAARSGEVRGAEWTVIDTATTCGPSRRRRTKAKARVSPGAIRGSIQPIGISITPSSASSSTPRWPPIQRL